MRSRTTKQGGLGDCRTRNHIATTASCSPLKVWHSLITQGERFLRSNSASQGHPKAKQKRSYGRCQLARTLPRPQARTQAHRTSTWQRFLLQDESLFCRQEWGVLYC